MPHYFDYMKDAYRKNKPTLMAKIVGVYRIGYQNSTNKQALKQDVFIMENLFYNRNVARIFDLKVRASRKTVKWWTADIDIYIERERKKKLSCLYVSTQSKRMCASFDRD